MIICQIVSLARAMSSRSFRFKWESEDVCDHLLAASGLFDSILINDGLDPHIMRKTFYERFTPIPRHKPSPQLLFELKDYDEITDTIFNVECGYSPSGWVLGNEYIFIRHMPDGSFMSRFIVHQCNICGRNDIFNFYNINPQRYTDFVAIMLEYGTPQLIIDKFGVMAVIEHIYSME